jgi:hypothetical protein
MFNGTLLRHVSPAEAKPAKYNEPDCIFIPLSALF